MPSPRLSLRATAIFADPCTGARKRHRSGANSPRGIDHGQSDGARVPPRCSKHRGRWVAPDESARFGKATPIRAVAHGAGKFRYVSRRHTWRASQEPREKGTGAKPGARVTLLIALYPHKTVAQNMAFPLRMAGDRPEEIERKVAAAAQMLDLTAYLGRKPGQLSGGQRQRVAIGRTTGRWFRSFQEPSSCEFGQCSRLHRRIGWDHRCMQQGACLLSCCC